MEKKMKNLLKLTAAAVIIAALIFATACDNGATGGGSKGGNGNGSGTPAIYITGNYAKNDRILHACYWKGGVRTDLSVPATALYGSVASKIIASGNNIYIIGAYYESDRSTVPAKLCYWKNGTRTELPIPATAIFARLSGITVVGNDVYVVGDYNDNNENNFCYWKNGTRTNVFKGQNYLTSGITVVGNDIYISGYYSTYTPPNVAYYWKNSVQTTLPVPALASPKTSAITSYGNNIYISGEYYDGYYTLPCYWKNGSRIDLAQPLSNNKFGGSTSFIEIVGGDVYVTGSYYYTDTMTACYWKNDLITVLQVPTGTKESNANSIAVLDDSVYIAGSYYYDNSSSKACYWKDGKRTDLPLPSGTVNSFPSGIAVVLE
jgi:hypothetical protein